MLIGRERKVGGKEVERGERGSNERKGGEQVKERKIEGKRKTEGLQENKHRVIPDTIEKVLWVSKVKFRCSASNAT